MGHLFVLLVVNSFTVFFLMILLGRTIWSMSINMTTIEEWEIERHQTLVRRSRHFGGYLTGPGGVRIRIKKQEFPYDIGIWSNIKAGMGGTANVGRFLSIIIFLRCKLICYLGSELVLAAGQNS